MLTRAKNAKRLDKFWADQNVMSDWTADRPYNRNRRSIGVGLYSRKWLESLEEVGNKDTDKEAHLPAWAPTGKGKGGHLTPPWKTETFFCNRVISRNLKNN